MAKQYWPVKVSYLVINFDLNLAKVNKKNEIFM